MYKFGWQQPSRRTILNTSASWLPYLWGNVNAQIRKQLAANQPKDEIVIS